MLVLLNNIQGMLYDLKKIDFFRMRICLNPLKFRLFT